MTTWWRPRRVIRARARRWSHRGIPWRCSYKLLQSTMGLLRWRQKIMKLNVSSYKNIVWKNPTKGYSSAETHVVEPWARVHIRCVIRECNRKRLTGENLWTSLVAKPQCRLLLAEKDETKNMFDGSDSWIGLQVQVKFATVADSLQHSCLPPFLCS
jgi:hypothetical protein